MNKIVNGIKRATGMENTEKGALPKMIAYSSASIGVASGSKITGPYYLPFLTMTEGISIGSATIMLFLRSIWDAVIDPFIGFMVDRTRTKIGKHRLYVILMAIPFGVSFSLLFNSFGISAKGTAEQLWLYHCMAGLLFATVASVLNIAHESMLPALAKGYFERTQYNSMVYIMNAVGMVPAQLLGTALVGIKSTKEFDPSMRPTMLKMGLLVGLISIVPILLSGIFTKERSSKNDVLPPLDVHGFFHEFALVFRNRAFRQYFALTFLYLFGASFFGISKPFYLKEVAKRWDLNSQLALVQGGFEMLMFPVNFAITKAFGKQKSAWITTPLLFLSFALGFLIQPQAAGATLLHIVIVLFAREIFYIIGYSGYGFTVTNIYPDVTDVDEMITGRRREATISTFSSFIKTMTSGFMASVVGILLEWFGVSQDDAKKPLFTARAKNLHRAFTPSFGLKLSNCLLPGLFIGLSLLSLRKYKMTKQDHALIRRVLAERHENGFAEATPEEQARLADIAGQPWESMWVGATSDRTPLR
ncbi:MAG: MFS transporter [Oscillospiraceae bacterium]|nr:MFS transporter [Oscillospiraceae bacterium]